MTRLLNCLMTFTFAAALLFHSLGECAASREVGASATSLSAQLAKLDWPVTGDPKEG